MREFRVLMLVAIVFSANEASAVGIADFVSAGINVVGKVGGAMVDKAMEDSPEEMERKRQQEAADREAKFHEAIAKIESRTDITPLDKEKLTRQISRTFGMAETISNLSAQQELRRREQRDRILTGGGIVGVVGDAALNTPSAIMARADIAVKTGVPQAQSRRAVEDADALMRTGQPQAQSRAAVEAAMSGGVVRSTVGNGQLGGSAGDKARAAEGVQNAIAQHRGEIEQAMSEVEAAKPKELLSEQELTNLASLDRGRKIYVEFVGGQKLTERLQQAFKSSGHIVVGSSAEADVVYQFDGEYAVSPESNRDGLSERVGAYMDNPHALESPQAQSSMKRAVGGFFASMAGIPVKQPSAVTTFRQGVLMVANRRFNGQDARVSASIKEESGMLEPDILIKSVLQDLIKTVGLTEVKPTEALSTNGALGKENI